MEKAAIVIGVNRSGDLPVLNATGGALQVGSWLRREGFHVEDFVDTMRPVEVGNLFNAVDRLVDRGTLEQLVIYFAGHGFLNNGSEHWMLSDAPHNPNEAVSLDESTKLARRCGIPNVVFISDACRSVPQTFQASMVRGSLIFPVLTPTGGAQLDRFYATLPGDPALEMPLGESARQFRGIYTNCFLEAFRHPDDDMVRSITINGVATSVVPNRNLANYLVREVNRTAQERSINLRQLPDSIVESGDSSFIGRVRRVAGFRPARPGPRGSGPVASVSEVARFELAQIIGGDSGSPSLDPSLLEDTSIRSGFDASVELVRSANERSDRYEFGRTGTGITVTGSSVTSTFTHSLQAEQRDSSLIELRRGIDRVGSVMLRFDDGSGTVLAGVEGYIATVVVDRGRVINVSYLPSGETRRWHGYDPERRRLEDLQAKVAAAAQSGVFRVERDRAGLLANEIRYMKSIDPTLGLYAAYAYSDAGLDEEALSVQRAMREDLGTDLFDVAMLAGRLSGHVLHRRRSQIPVPFVPMLSQGWGLLRVMGVQLEELVSDAADYLRPALWTTFEARGMDIIEEAMHTGGLK